MRVDGFRFDLAPIVGRDSAGYSRNAPFFAALRSDPVLAYVKLIAEPWDVDPAATAWALPGRLVGSGTIAIATPCVRFWRGDRPMTRQLRERFAGSSDLFREHGGKPTASVNLVTAHDGFTLNDLVSYNERHNAATSRTEPTGTPTTSAGIVAPKAVGRSGRSRAPGRQVRNLLADAVSFARRADAARRG